MTIKRGKIDVYLDCGHYLEEHLASSTFDFPYDPLWCSMCRQPVAINWERMEGCYGFGPDEYPADIFERPVENVATESLGRATWRGFNPSILCEQAAAGRQVAEALRALLLNYKDRRWLKENDPVSLKQAQKAVRIWDLSASKGGGLTKG